MMKVKQIVDSIKQISKTVGISPNDVTVGDLVTFGVSERQIKNNGGLVAIKKAHFPIDEKELVEIRKLNVTNQYINKLEKAVGDNGLFEEKLLKSINNLITPIAKIKEPKKVKNKKRIDREIVMMLNDTHYGLIVEKDEVNGVNSFSWKEASRRTAMVLNEAINFKPHTRDEVNKIHLILNGDIIAGLIHGLNTKGLDLYVHQINGTLHILTNVMVNLLKNFKEVEITGISGNHCDAVHKREHGNRVITEKYDSYLNTVFYALSCVFKDNPRAKFNFPKTPYAFFNLPAGRAMIAHGDVIFSKALGNPGTTINVKSLSEEIRKFNEGEVSRGKEPVKLVLFGHTHSFAHFTTSGGVEVYNAPSLSGTDGFAHSLNINNNFIGQVVFESTKDFILGDHRLIRVNKADDNSSLDELIPIFNRSLKWTSDDNT